MQLSMVSNACPSHRGWAGQLSTQFRQCRLRSQLRSVNKERDSAHVSTFGFATNLREKFILGDQIGSGGFGTVYVATDRASGEKYAVKSIKKRMLGGKLMEESFVRRVRHEVDVYNHLGRSLNVACLYGAYESDVAVDLVMMLCTGGDLLRRMRRTQASEQEALRIMSEVVRTIAQCHAKDIVIRDIKPENFLFLNDSPTSPLKAIDFGSATWCRRDEKLTDRAGTPLYVAPDVLRRSYGQKIDLWSAGVMGYQLLTGRLPFEDEDGLMADLHLNKHSFSNKEVFGAILSAPLDFEKPPWRTQLSEDARSFIQLLLQRDPAKRPTAIEALQHPWLAGVSGTVSSSDFEYDSGHQSDGTSAASRSEAGAAASTSYRGHEVALASHPLLDSLVQRLQRFGTFGFLKQLALRRIAACVPDDHPAVVPVRDAFEALDTQKTGQVPYSSIVQLLLSGAFDLSRVEVMQLLKPFDRDMDSQVERLEWLTVLLDWRLVQQSPEWDGWVQQVFKLYDETLTGSLTLDELTHILCSESACDVADVAPAAMRSADLDHDNLISQTEFSAYMRTSKSDRLDLFESRRVHAVPAGARQ